MSNSHYDRLPSDMTVNHVTRIVHLNSTADECVGTPRSAGKMDASVDDAIAYDPDSGKALKSIGLHNHNARGVFIPGKDNAIIEKLKDGATFEQLLGLVDGSVDASSPNEAAGSADDDEGEHGHMYDSLFGQMSRLTAILRVFFLTCAIMTNSMLKTHLTPVIVRITRLRPVARRHQNKDMQSHNIDDDDDDNNNDVISELGSDLEDDIAERRVALPVDDANSTIGYVILLVASPSLERYKRLYQRFSKLEVVSLQTLLDDQAGQDPQIQDEASQTEGYGDPMNPGGIMGGDDDDDSGRPQKKKLTSKFKRPTFVEFGEQFRAAMNLAKDAITDYRAKAVISTEPTPKRSKQGASGGGMNSSSDVHKIDSCIRSKLRNDIGEMFVLGPPDPQKNFSSLEESLQTYIGGSLSRQSMNKIRDDADFFKYTCIVECLQQQCGHYAPPLQKHILSNLTIASRKVYQIADVFMYPPSIFTDYRQCVLMNMPQNAIGPTLEAMQIHARDALTMASISPVHAKTDDLDAIIIDVLRDPDFDTVVISLLEPSISLPLQTQSVWMAIVAIRLIIKQCQSARTLKGRQLGGESVPVLRQHIQKAYARLSYSASDIRELGRAMYEQSQEYLTNNQDVHGDLESQIFNNLQSVMETAGPAGNFVPNTRESRAAVFDCVRSGSHASNSDTVRNMLSSIMKRARAIVRANCTFIRNVPLKSSLTTSVVSLVGNDSHRRYMPDRDDKLASLTFLGSKKAAGLVDIYLKFMTNPSCTDVSMRSAVANLKDTLGSQPSAVSIYASLQRLREHAVQRASFNSEANGILTGRIATLSYLQLLVESTRGGPFIYHLGKIGNEGVGKGILCNLGNVFQGRQVIRRFNTLGGWRQLLVRHRHAVFHEEEAVKCLLVDAESTFNNNSERGAVMMAMDGKVVVANRDTDYDHSSADTDTYTGTRRVVLVLTFNPDTKGALIDKAAASRMLIMLFTNATFGYDWSDFREDTVPVGFLNIGESSMTILFNLLSVGILPRFQRPAIDPSATEARCAYPNVDRMLTWFMQHVVGMNGVVNAFTKTNRYQTLMGQLFDTVHLDEVVHSSIRYLVTLLSQDAGTALEQWFQQGQSAADALHTLETRPNSEVQTCTLLKLVTTSEWLQLICAVYLVAQQHDGKPEWFYSTMLTALDMASDTLYGHSVFQLIGAARYDEDLMPKDRTGLIMYKSKLETKFTGVAARGRKMGVHVQQEDRFGLAEAYDWLQGVAASIIEELPDDERETLDADRDNHKSTRGGPCFVPRSMLRFHFSKKDAAIITALLRLHWSTPNMTSDGLGAVQSCVEPELKGKAVRNLDSRFLLPARHALHLQALMGDSVVLYTPARSLLPQDNKAPVLATHVSGTQFIPCKSQAFGVLFVDCSNEDAYKYLSDIDTDMDACCQPVVGMWETSIAFAFSAISKLVNEAFLTSLPKDVLGGDDAVFSYRPHWNGKTDLPTCLDNFTFDDALNRSFSEDEVHALFDALVSAYGTYERLNAAATAIGVNLQDANEIKLKLGWSDCRLTFTRVKDLLTTREPVQCPVAQNMKAILLNSRFTCQVYAQNDEALLRLAYHRERMSIASKIIAKVTRNGQLPGDTNNRDKAMQRLEAVWDGRPYMKPMSGCQVAMGVVDERVHTLMKPTLPGHVWMSSGRIIERAQSLVGDEETIQKEDIVSCLRRVIADRGFTERANQHRPVSLYATGSNDTSGNDAYASLHKTCFKYVSDDDANKTHYFRFEYKAIRELFLLMGGPVVDMARSMAKHRIYRTLDLHVSLRVRHPLDWTRNFLYFQFRSYDQLKDITLKAKPKLDMRVGLRPFEVRAMSNMEDDMKHMSSTLSKAFERLMPSLRERYERQYGVIQTAASSQKQREKRHSSTGRADDPVESRQRSLLQRLNTYDLRKYVYTPIASRLTHTEEAHLTVQQCLADGIQVSTPTVCTARDHVDVMRESLPGAETFYQTKVAPYLKESESMSDESKKRFNGKVAIMEAPESDFNSDDDDEDDGELDEYQMALNMMQSKSATASQDSDLPDPFDQPSPKRAKKQETTPSESSEDIMCSDEDETQLPLESDSDSDGDVSEDILTESNEADDDEPENNPKRLPLESNSNEDEDESEDILTESNEADDDEPENNPKRLSLESNSNEDEDESEDILTESSEAGEVVAEEDPGAEEEDEEEEDEEWNLNAENSIAGNTDNEQEEPTVPSTKNSFVLDEVDDDGNDDDDDDDF